MNTAKRKKTTKTVVVLLVAASLVSIGSYQAFAKRGGGHGGYGDHFMRGGGHGGYCDNSMMTGKMNRGPQGKSALGLWKNPRIVEKLGITDEQIAQLKEADFTAREKHIALQAELEAARLNMQKSFSAETVDRDAALKLAQETAEIRSKMFVQRTENRLQALEILTQEQHDKLKELRMEFRGGRHHNGKGLGMNRGNGQGPMYPNSANDTFSPNS